MKVRELKRERSEWEMRAKQLEAALLDLMLRCDGPEGVRADGSNIDTAQASSVLYPNEGQS